MPGSKYAGIAEASFPAMQEFSAIARTCFAFFSLPENPFGDNPNPRYLFLTRWAQEALTEIPDRIRKHEGLIVLTGEAGTGKTTLIRSVLGSLRQQQEPAALISNSHLKVSDLFDLISAEFGIRDVSDVQTNALKRIYLWLVNCRRARKTPVVFIDEAQGLSDSVLEKMRLLLKLKSTHEKLLQIVLAGQPELEHTLGRHELRPLWRRVSYRCQTEPLRPEETHGYIHERLRIAGSTGELVFSSEAIDTIHLYSRGIPRVVNLLCEHALLNAYAEGIRPVPARLVEEVATEFELGSDETSCVAYVPGSLLIDREASDQLPDIQAPGHSTTGHEANFEPAPPMVPPQGQQVPSTSLHIPLSQGTPYALKEERGKQIHPEFKGWYPKLASLFLWLSEPIRKTSLRQAQPLTTSEIPVHRQMRILSAVRPLQRQLLYFRDQCIPYVRLDGWLRLAAFILLWLKEPMGTVKWHRVKPATSLPRWLRQPMHW